jgi:predicted metal-dependent hydrolase
MFRKPTKRPERRLRSNPVDRQASARSAVELFNRGDYWEAHEALEAIWRSVADEGEARILQGLIQAAAALLHQRRGNQHGVRVVGEAALEKLQGKQHPAIEFDTEALRRDLARALQRGGPAPVLKLKDVA